MDHMVESFLGLEGSFLALVDGYDMPVNFASFSYPPYFFTYFSETKPILLGKCKHCINDKISHENGLWIEANLDWRRPWRI